MVLFSKCIFTYTVFFTSSIKLQLQLYPRHRHTGPSYRHYTTQNTPITKKHGSVSVWATMGCKSQPCSCMCKGFSQSPRVSHKVQIKPPYPLSWQSFFFLFQALLLHVHYNRISYTLPFCTMPIFFISSLEISFEIYVTAFYRVFLLFSIFFATPFSTYFVL